MINYRQTYAQINLKAIEENAKIITSTYDYKYKIAVVKADCYAHQSNKVVEKLISGGFNYLAVSSLEEALNIREFNKEIPILCLGLISPIFIDVCINENISITIDSLEYLNKLKNTNNLNVHIKLDTGMNRLGVKEDQELKEILNKLKELNINLEGIYTHIYNAVDKSTTYQQVDRFNKLVEDNNLTDTKIIHIANSETITLYDKLKYVNGYRAGIIMYGLIENNLNLKSTFKLISKVVEIKQIKKGETVGYNGLYKAEQDEKIAIVPIGYADGIIRKNTGRIVYINNKKYKIIGNICMDVLFVKIDDTIKVDDIVEIIKDNNHIKEIAKHLETIPYEVICNIGKRVPREYIEN